MKRDIEAVLKAAKEDFSSADCHYIEEGASHNMHDNIEKLIASVCCVPLRRFLFISEMKIQK